MPTAYITRGGSSVRLHSERIQVWERDDQGRDRLIREMPIRDLDRVIITERVHLSMHALGALLEHEIPISLLDGRGRYMGGFLPCGNHHGRSRLRQYQRTLDAEFALTMAGRIVAAKIYNQRRVIQRLAANRKLSMSEELTTLNYCLARCAECRSLDELRGHEGASTAKYFSIWSRFLPEAFPFEERSTRPPLNPVNACISFAATLVYHEAAAFCHARGLDPALGLLHQTENGRWSLALDLIEPFRPVLVEALALDLFTHRILDGDGFEPRNGGIYLNDAGRRVFLLQYERRMERQFMSEHLEHRTTLRNLLEEQAVAFKSALEAPEKFEPFLMN